MRFLDSGSASSSFRCLVNLVFTELDEETGLYYYGARYLNPKYSMWLSCEPALSDYMAGSSAGCGGVFNPVNFNLYHYGGNNPIKYTDPDGRDVKQFELKLHITVPELEKFVLAAVRTNTHIQNGYSATDALVPLTNALNGISIIDSIIAAGTKFAFNKSTSLNPYVVLGITGLGILAEFCINNSNKAEAEKNFKKIAEFYTEVTDLYDSGFFFAVVKIILIRNHCIYYFLTKRTIRL